MSRKMLKSFGSTKPIRMWIDGKCFNIKQFNRKSKKTTCETIIICDDGNKTENVEIMEIEQSNEIDIAADDNGKLCISFQLPSIYYIKLHQFNDLDVKSLSEKTQTDISFPKHGNNGKLTITGESPTNIREALDEIHSVISAIRDQYAALQFISIPLQSDEVRSNFEKFKSEILSEKNVKGMDESIFQKALKLHLTIVVFALLDEREKREAINALEEYRKSVLSPLVEKTGPLKIHVKGIDCMNDDYKKVDVLYATAKIINKTDETNLQKIANGLSDYFYERGLVLRYKEDVKLHMTLINTKYRKVPESPVRRRWNKKVSFDATNIMEKYKDFAFGECSMDSIHLSLVSSTGEDGFYKPLSIIKI